MGRFPFAVPPKGKKMKYFINYKKTNELEKKFVDINFVPNMFHRRYKEIQDQMQAVHSLWVEWKNNISDRGTAIIERDKALLKKLEDREIEIKAEIEAYNKNDFFKKRFELVKYILGKNNVEENDELMTFDWWEDNTEPDAIIAFLAACSNKDIIESEKKKVLTNSMKADSSQQ